jgi:hypothetical protein
MHGPEDPPLTPIEERVQSVVRSLPHAQADPAFRNRLRREFSTGYFEKRRSRVPEPTIAGWFTWRWATAATAVLLVIAFAFVNRGPDWRIMSATGTGSVVVNGKTIAVSNHSALANALRRGGQVTVPAGSELTLLSKGTLLVQAAPETDMRLPTPPGRWIAKNMRAVVSKGEARLLTGPRFKGRGMDIGTPAGNTVITGTLVSVVTDGAFTCVCVTEGTASVGKSPTTMEFVPAGMRKVMWNDTRPAVMLPIEPEHGAGLATLLREHGQDVEK